ncbi:MAG TPA: hypothetical protein CFH84_09280 [Sulfurimonas sp. UBA12504]|nr:MAG: hypothetical protein A2019_06430 [Sulfurimonas sp. GWF2_37_8]DAB29471.1 MAG TPA: hypothetical protein CFH84_09280 [Sulfurimonas sp. UBA12504]
MVKKLLRFFAYFAFFILALIYFSPKESIYYLLENELKTYSVIISDETLEDSGIYLTIQNAAINVKSIQSAKIQNCDVTLLLLYNSLNASDIMLSESLKSFVPLKIETLSFTQSIFDPLHLHIHAVGAFGEAKGSINLLEKTIHIELVASELMQKEYKNALREFTKSQEGGLVYDKSF